jgi:hypothetical protein
MDHAIARQLTLELDLILDNEGLALVIDLLGELGRDGVVGSCVLDDQTLIALHSLEDVRLLNRPLSNVGPFLLLVGALGVLLGVGRLPAGLPVVGELLNKVALDSGGLGRKLVNCCKVLTQVAAFCAGD